MSTSLKSGLSARAQAGRNTIFHATEPGAEKNGRRICPINDDLVLTLTFPTPWLDPSASLRTGKLTTSKATLFTRPACLAAGRRSQRHDA